MTDTYRPTVPMVIHATATHYGHTTDDLLGRSRAQHLARPRQVAMFVARRVTGLSLPEIGRHFDRHHSTILHGIETIDQEFIDHARAVAAIELDLVEDAKPASGHRQERTVETVDYRHWNILDKDRDLTAVAVIAWRRGSNHGHRVEWIMLYEHEADPELLALVGRAEAAAKVWMEATG